MRQLFVKIFCLATFLFIFGRNPTCFSEDSRNPNDWYQRARDDFEVAEVLFGQTAHYGAVCFHAHQAAEKELKGALISRGALPDKFHYTAELAENLSHFIPKAETLVASCQELDRIYVSSRYPKRDGINFTHEEASNCLQNAKPVLDFVIEQKEPVELTA